MDKLVEFLSQQWLYDMEVMSQPWMYWCLMIPITFYVVFFFAKWSILTAPVWLPFVIIANNQSGKIVLKTSKTTVKESTDIPLDQDNINLMARIISDRVAENTGIAPQLVFGPTVFALQDIVAAGGAKKRHKIEQQLP